MSAIRTLMLVVLIVASGAAVDIFGSQSAYDEKRNGADFPAVPDLTDTFDRWTADGYTWGWTTSMDPVGPLPPRTRLDYGTWYAVSDTLHEYPRVGWYLTCDPWYTGQFTVRLRKWLQNSADPPEIAYDETIDFIVDVSPSSFPTGYYQYSYGNRWGSTNIDQSYNGKTATYSAPWLTEGTNQTLYSFGQWWHASYMSGWYGATQDTGIRTQAYKSGGSAWVANYYYESGTSWRCETLPGTPPMSVGPPLDASPPPTMAGCNPYKSGAFQALDCQHYGLDRDAVISIDASVATPDGYWEDTTGTRIYYDASPQITVRVQPDAWCRTGEPIYYRYRFTGHDGATGTMHGAFYIARVNNAPTFQNPGVLEFAVPTYPDGNGPDTGPHRITMNNVLAMLTPGGTYGDPWEEIYPTGTNPANEVPEDVITNVTSTIRGVGFVMPATIALGGEPPRIPIVSGVNMTLTPLATDDLSVGGKGRRRQANMTLEANIGDATQVDVAVEATVRDNYGAETTQAFIVRLNAVPQTITNRPPPRSDRLLGTAMLPQASFLKGYIPTIPASARNRNPPGNLATAALHTVSNELGAAVAMSRFGYLPDWHMNAFGSNVAFPPLYVWAGMDPVVDDDDIWRKDEHAQFRGMVIPILWRGMKSEHWQVVGYEEPNDYDVPPTVVSNGLPYLAVRWKWKPNAPASWRYGSPGTYNQNYNITVNLAPASGYAPLTTPLTITARLLQPGYADERPINKQFGMEALRTSPTTQTFPNVGDYAFDGRSLVMPWLHPTLGSAWRMNTTPTLYPYSGAADWDAKDDLPLGYVLVPVDTGDVSAVGAHGNGQVRIEDGSLDAAFRHHRYRVQEVQIDGTLTALRPHQLFAGLDSWTIRSHYENIRQYLEPSSGTPSIQIRDQIDRTVPARNLSVAPAPPTGTETGQLATALTTVYGSVAAAATAGRTYVARTIGSAASSWDTYSNTKHWRLVGEISHTDGTGVTIGQLAIVDASGTVVRSIDPATVTTGSAGTIRPDLPMWYPATSIIAVIPLGQPSSWGATGPGEVNLLWSKATQDVRPNVGAPTGWPLMKRGEQTCGLTWSTYSASPDMFPWTTANTGATRWGNSCHIRSDDELTCVALLRMPYKNASPTTDPVSIQYGLSDTIMRIDLLDATERPSAQVMTDDLVVQTTRGTRPQRYQLDVTSVAEATVPVSYAWSGPTAVSTPYTIALSPNAYYNIAFEIPATNAALTNPVVITSSSLHGAVSHIQVGSTLYYNYWGTFYSAYDFTQYSELTINPGDAVTITLDTGYYNSASPPTTILTYTDQGTDYIYSLGWARRTVPYNAYATYGSDQSNTVNWTMKKDGITQTSGQVSNVNVWDTLYIPISTPTSWGASGDVLVWPDGVEGNPAYTNAPPAGPWVMGSATEVTLQTSAYNLGENPYTLMRAEDKPDPYPIVDPNQNMPLAVVPSVRQASINQWTNNARHAMVDGVPFSKTVSETRPGATRLGEDGNWPFGGWKWAQYRNRMAPDFVLWVPRHERYFSIPSTAFGSADAEDLSYYGSGVIDRVDIPERAVALTSHGYYPLTATFDYVGSGDYATDVRGFASYEFRVSFTPAQVGFDEGLVIWQYGRKNPASGGESTTHVQFLPIFSSWNAGDETLMSLTVGGDTVNGTGSVATGRFAVTATTPSLGYVRVGPSETITVRYRWKRSPESFMMLAGEADGATWSPTTIAMQQKLRWPLNPMQFYASFKHAIRTYDTSTLWGE